MTSYQTYVFLMCLIVFFMLASLSILCISIIMRLTLRLIDHGVEDEKILEEYRKQQKKKQNKHAAFLSYAFSGIVCFVLLIFLVTSLAIKGTEGSFVDDLPVYRVVNTGSMSKKNPKNTYLTANGLNDQIQTFDLIRTEKLPDEMDLELYDIVVYETDGMLIVHRIVEIEEPNSTHPDCRYFKLQGDAVDSADRFPVLYEQMRAIYRGDRIPFLGSFVLFMQSPAGWICALFAVLSVFAMPILEGIIQKAKDKRLLLYIKKEEPLADEEKSYVFKHTSFIVATDLGKLGEVDLGKLDTSYNSGDLVDIASLKEKGLIDVDCQSVSVVDKGEITKPITVRANKFAPKAVKAIIAAGGTVMRVFKIIAHKDEPSDNSSDSCENNTAID